MLVLALLHALIIASVLMMTPWAITRTSGLERVIVIVLAITAIAAHARLAFLTWKGVGG